MSEKEPCPELKLYTTEELWEELVARSSSVAVLIKEKGEKARGGPGQTFIHGDAPDLMWMIECARQSILDNSG